MSLFLVVQEAKVYRQFYVNAESPIEAMKLVEEAGCDLPHTSEPIRGEEKVVEIWIEEATVPVWQIDAPHANSSNDQLSLAQRTTDSREH